MTTLGKAAVLVRDLTDAELRACLAEWRRRSERKAGTILGVREAQRFADLWCTCGHPDSEHLSGRGCKPADGPRCRCREFRHGRLLVIADLPEAK